MKPLRIRLILGLIAATVTAADEQVLRLYRMNEATSKADNQGFGAVMGKPRRSGVMSDLTPETCHRVTGRLLVIEKLVSGIEPLFGTRF